MRNHVDSRYVRHDAFNKDALSKHVARARAMTAVMALAAINLGGKICTLFKKEAALAAGRKNE